MGKNLVEKKKMSSCEAFFPQVIAWFQANGRAVLWWDRLETLWVQSGPYADVPVSLFQVMLHVWFLVFTVVVRATWDAATKCWSLSCVWLFAIMDCSPLGSFVHGILQARILEWVAIPFSRGSSRPRDRILFSCIAGRLFTVWTTREATVWAAREAGPLCLQGQQICWSGLMETPNLIKHLIWYYAKEMLALPFCLIISHPWASALRSHSYKPTIWSSQDIEFQVLSKYSHISGHSPLSSVIFLLGLPYARPSSTCVPLVSARTY